MRENNPGFSGILDDSFYAQIGCDVLDTLNYSKMIQKQLVPDLDTRTKAKHYVLKVVYEKLLHHEEKNPVFTIPTKLPMVCKPNTYSKGFFGWLFIK